MYKKKLINTRDNQKPDKKRHRVRPIQTRINTSTESSFIEWFQISQYPRKVTIEGIISSAGAAVNYDKI